MVRTNKILKNILRLRNQSTSFLCSPTKLPKPSRSLWRNMGLKVRRKTSMAKEKKRWTTSSLNSKNPNHPRRIKTNSDMMWMLNYFFNNYSYIMSLLYVSILWVCCILLIELRIMIIGINNQYSFGWRLNSAKVKPENIIRNKIEKLKNENSTLPDRNEYQNNYSQSNKKYGIKIITRHGDLKRGVWVFVVAGESDWW